MHFFRLCLEPLYPSNIQMNLVQIKNMSFLLLIIWMKLRVSYFESNKNHDILAENNLGHINGIKTPLTVNIDCNF